MWLSVPRLSRYSFITAEFILKFSTESSHWPSSQVGQRGVWAAGSRATFAGHRGEGFWASSQERAAQAPRIQGTCSHGICDIRGTGEGGGKSCVYVHMCVCVCLSVCVCVCVCVCLHACVHAHLLCAHALMLHRGYVCVCVYEHIVHAHV